jgi:hypothetical protein
MIPRPVEASLAIGYTGLYQRSFPWVALREWVELSGVGVLFGTPSLCYHCCLVVKFATVRFTTFR